MGKQPGVMFYFNTRPALDKLTLDEQGLLFRAILDYGELGLVPEFDRMLGLAWEFIRPLLDRDRERYQLQCRKKEYAVYVRECKRSMMPPLSYAAWEEEFVPGSSDDDV